MRIATRLLVAVVAAVPVLVRPSLAMALVEDCEANDKPVNLNNGATTEHLTGVIHCRDRQDPAHPPTREFSFKDGKQDGWYKDLRQGRSWGSGPKWIEYRSGNPDGCRKEWDLDGKVLLQESTCVDGHPLVEKSYFPSGKLKSEATHHSGETNDVFRVTYDEQGRVSELMCGATFGRKAGTPQCPYEKKTTEVRTYYPNGKVREVWPFKDGLFEGAVEHYRSSGELTGRDQYHAGLRAGAVDEYGDHGQLRHSTSYQDRQHDGEEKGYFPQGQVAYLLDWQKDVLQRARIYYQNGQVRVDLARADAKINAHGFWDLGKPQYEGQYRLDREASFAQAVNWRLPDGAPSLGQWLGYGGRDFIPVGIQQTFYESGQPSEVAHYDDQGRHQGTVAAFFETGQLKSEAQYEVDVLLSKKEFTDQGVLTLDEDYFPDGSRKAKRK